MLKAGVSANLMSLGALDFGLIVDGAVIIVENALRRLAERQHHEGRLLTVKERLASVAAAAREMIRPSVYGQAIIILVYVPLLTLTGVEGKTFVPMALTVIIALAFAFVLSLTFVPAMIAIWLSKKVDEEDGRIVTWLKKRYEPGLDRAMRRPTITIGAAVGSLVLAVLAFGTLGQVFLPQLDEGDLLIQSLRIPATSVQQSQAMQVPIERMMSKQPEVQFVYSKTGTAELASDPMPPNATDMFVILKPRDAWPDPKLAKEDLVKRIEGNLAKFPGNAYEITQPIQMRFNELIAGVRGDIAVKVFGDDFSAMNRTAEQVASILRKTQGAADVKVEQTTGLPMLDIRVNRDAMARLGVTAQDVQDTVTATLGGRTSGQIFEGDRRFPVVIRLSEAQRSDLGLLQQVQVPVAGGSFVPLSSVADIGVVDGPNQISRENGKRRVVVQANVRGRDVGSVVADAQAAIGSQVRLPPGSYLEWGGQFENLQSASARLKLVIPACFVLILFLLYGAWDRCVMPRSCSPACPSRWWAACCFLRARHGLLDLRRGGLHRAVRHRGPQRPRHGQLHPGPDPFGHGPRRGGACWCDAAPASGRHDGAGGIARLRTDGARTWCRCRGAEAAGDGRHRRADLGDAADALRASHPLRAVRAEGDRAAGALQRRARRR
jgi:cobalt-zinc-cadmium resistance protein CzcA